MRLAIVVVLAACGSKGGAGGPAATQAEAARACVMYGSCLIDDGVNDCMTDVLPTLPPDAVRCMGEAADCTTALACVGITVSWATCTPRGYACTNNALVDCEQLLSITVECGSPLSTGPTCIASSNGTNCGVGTCTAPQPGACVGDHAQNCDPRGVLEDLDCAAEGLACVNGLCTEPDGGGACTAGVDRCEGTEIVSCQGGEEVRIDCAKRIAGSTCHVAAGHSEAYCGFGDECYPSKGSEMCAGSVMTYCANGVVATIDCTSIGLTTCSTVMNGCMR